MNHTLWHYFQDNFEVDVITGLTVDTATVHRLGIRDVFSTHDKGMLTRVIRRINRAALHMVKLLGLTEFFVGSDLGGTFAGIYRIVGHARWRLLAGGALWELRHQRPWSWLLGFLSRFPIAHPTGRILASRPYEAVVLGHTNETECVIAARYASRIGVPTICPVMGVDNMMHGLLQFKPELLLLWGSAQEEEFVRFQQPRRQDLSTTQRAIVGCLAYDGYVQVLSCREQFRCELELAPDDEVLLYAAYPEAGLAGQAELCQLLVDFIRRYQLKVKLLIRLRPGTPLAMWEGFRNAHADVIRLQVPVGSAFGKTDEVGLFSWESAQRDIHQFAQTIRNSALLVLPSLSTMYQDALAFDVPSVVALFRYTRQGDLPHRDYKTYLDYLTINPTYRTIQVATSREQLEDFLVRFFVRQDRAGLLPTEFFRYQTASSNDGASGRRAVQAISAFRARRANMKALPAVIEG